MTGQDLHKYYKILDVTPDTPWEDIKRAYHDMMKVWHPDRFAGDPRLQKIVEEKTKELTHAFKKIEEDYHSIKFYDDPLDEAKEASIKTKTKPPTEPPVKEGKPKPSSRYARKQEAEEKRKISFKQVGLYIMAIICVLFGIIAFTLPIFLSKDNEKGEPKKEMTKGIVIPASPFSILEKAVPVQAPLPISDYEKAFKAGKDKPRNDTRSIRQIKETGLIPSTLEREKPIKERAPEVTPAEKEDPSVKKKQGRIQRENNQRIFEKKIDRVKKGEIQDSGKKTITEVEKEREPEEKKAQQFEKLRELEKEFPFEMIKER